MKNLLRSILFIVSILFVLQGCINKEEGIPENIIQKEKMTQILGDVQLIEAIRQRGTILPKDLDPDEESKRQYALVFEKYNITEEEFKESFNWYLVHPTILADIYDHVLVQLTEDQANIQSEMSAKKVKVKKTEEESNQAQEAVKTAEE